MLSQMNYRKETQPHGDELFPLSIHVFETDLQSTVRVYCHWHEEVELFYAVKGEAVFHMDTETFLLREGETAFVNANRLHEVEGIDGQEFTFLAVVFQPRFLSGTSLDRIQQQYIEPVLSSEIRFPSKTERGDTPCRKNGTGHAGDPKSAGKKRTGLGAAVKSGTSENLAGILQCGRKERRKNGCLDELPCQQNERDPHIHECSFL